jgi:PadR family transcriptional regulator, regulatory protein AphA
VSAPTTPRLPSTSQRTLLGLLSLRSWTAYELTLQMQRAVRWVWPRSEASIYHDLKRLVPDHAVAHEETVGERSRTRYEVSDAGRDEVRRWLREAEPERPRVQVEAVLRVFLADLAGPDDLRRTLDATRRQITEQLEEILPVLEDYAAGGGDFPGRVHLNGLFMHYCAGFFDHLLTWCDDVEAELDTWPDTANVGMNERTRSMIQDAIAVHRRAIDRFGDRSGARSATPDDQEERA